MNKKRVFALMLAGALTLTGIMGKLQLNASAEELPAVYDGRTEHTLPDALNQGDLGICWAYAAISQVNYNRLAAGNTDMLSDEAVFSFASGFYSEIEDSLDHATGDANVSKETEVSTEYKSGNAIYNTFALANGFSLDEDILVNAHFVDVTDRDALKKAIQSYGMVAISIYEGEGFYNDDSSTYFNPSVTAVNHTLNLVGWDDNYDVSSFTKLPSASGAFLAQNTYGPEVGEGGYVWISYEDLAFSFDSYGVSYVTADRSSYSEVFQHDGSSAFYTEAMTADATKANYQVANGGKVANVYTTQDGGKLTAVSLGVLESNVKYSLQIYSEPEEEDDPTTGTALLKKAQTGTISGKGISLITLKKAVTLEEDETFAIVLTLTNPSGGEVTYLMDESYDSEYWISFTNATEEGQSLRSVDGKSWQDMTSLGGSIRLKGYMSLSDEDEDEEEDPDDVISDEDTEDNTTDAVVPVDTAPSSPKTGEW